MTICKTVFITFVGLTINMKNPGRSRGQNKTTKIRKQKPPPLLQTLRQPYTVREKIRAVNLRGPIALLLANEETSAPINRVRSPLAAREVPDRSGPSPGWSCRCSGSRLRRRGSSSKGFSGAGVPTGTALALRVTASRTSDATQPTDLVPGDERRPRRREPGCWPPPGGKWSAHGRKESEEVGGRNAVGSLYSEQVKTCSL